MVIRGYSTEPKSEQLSSHADIHLHLWLHLLRKMVLLHHKHCKSATYLHYNGNFISETYELLMLGFIVFLLFFVGMREMRTAHKILVVKPEWKGWLERPRIIFSWVLEKLFVMVWSELSGSRWWPVVGHCEQSNVMCFVKWGEISLPALWLLAM